MQNLILANSNNSTMSSQEIADLVSSRHDTVRLCIERLAEKSVFQLPPLAEVKNHLGQTVKVYQIGKRDSYVIVAQLSPEFTGRLVDRWQELESQQASNVVAMPDFSNPVLAARAWADQYEARLIAEKTKAEIGSRREATAMNTASQAVKLVTKLEIELDKSKQYATVKRVEMLYHGQKFDWRLLRSVGNQMGIPAIDVFDANYGTVKAYHNDVWREAFAIEINPMREAA